LDVIVVTIGTIPFAGMLTVQVELWKPQVVGLAVLKNPTVTLVGGPGVTDGVRVAVPAHPLILVRVVTVSNDWRGAMSIVPGLMLALKSSMVTLRVIVIIKVVVLALTTEA
jgi:hypothetical protein